MEQIIHVFGLDWKLLLIQGANFLILLGLLSYFLYRPILAMLEKREKVIADGVLAAEAAGEDRKRAQEEYVAEVAKASKDAEGIVARGRDEARKEGAELVREARAEEKRIREDAEQRAEEIKRRAEESSREDVARAAVLAAEKILKEKLAK